MMHTVGKWIVEKRKVGFRVSSKVERKVHSSPLTYETDYYKVADVYYEENANLIASAPELLEVCKMIVAENNGNSETLGELASAIDWIADKAQKAIKQLEA